jgi:Zn-dependent M16 (insulinase) family peptidase
MHYDGTAVVLQKILSLDYMWNKVRVQGGAYGANARCTIDGLLVCSSYRDPNLERTYEAYAGVVDYLLAFDANEEDMTKYIIGVFSSLDIPEKAKEQASNCDHRYFSRITDEERQERRDQILAVTANDIRETARFVSEAYQKYRGICTVGASDAVDTAATLFDTIE